MPSSAVATLRALAVRLCAAFHQTCMGSRGHRSCERGSVALFDAGHAEAGTRPALFR